MNSDNPNKTPLTLSDIPKKNIYQVPDGYFEKLPFQIQQKTSALPTTNSIFAWWRYKLAIGTVGFSAVVMLVVYFTILKPTPIQRMNTANNSRQNKNNIATHKGDTGVQEIGIENKAPITLNHNLKSIATNSKTVEIATGTKDTASPMIPNVEAKLNAVALIAKLDKASVADYLKTENIEEYEWEEVSVKL